MALGFRFYVTSAECTSFIFKIVDAEKLIYKSYDHGAKADKRRHSERSFIHSTGDGLRDTCCLTAMYVTHHTDVLSLPDQQKARM